MNFNKGALDKDFLFISVESDYIMNSSFKFLLFNKKKTKNI